MRNYEIVIIDRNLLESIQLKEIIVKTCPYQMKTSCYLSFDSAMRGLNKSVPDILMIDVSLYVEPDFEQYKTFSDRGVNIVFLTDRKHSILNDKFRKEWDIIDKPYNQADIQETINRIYRQQLRLQVDYSTRRQSNIVTIHSVCKTEFLDMREIIFCSADGRYTTFHLSSGAEITSSKNLGSYEKVLDRLFFFRVHHTYIVNINYLTSIIKNDGYFCQLINNINVPVAKRKQSDFNRFLRLN